MNPEILMIASAGIISFIGIVHMVLTFWGTKHFPRDRSLVDAMANTTPEIIIADRDTLRRLNSTVPCTEF